jgi:hypothetical protein
LRDAPVLHLAFDDHVHELDAAKNDACTTKILEAQHRSGATLDGTVVLLDDVVQGICRNNDAAVEFALPTLCFGPR